MWGDRREIQCYGLSKVWNGGEGYDIHSLWLVMLEYAKNRVLGVDTLGQQVLPCVWYGTTCLLIRDATKMWLARMSENLALLLAQAHTVQEALWYRDYPGKL
jgi:hypothetical protein